MIIRLTWFIFLLSVLMMISEKSISQTYDGSYSVDLLYGQDFNPPDTEIGTVTLNHSATYGAAEQYGFIDIFYSIESEEISAHFEWYPKLSLSRLKNERVGFGPVEDVLLGGGINADFWGESDLFVWLVGPVWNFSIPGFESFQLETYYYKQTNESEFDGTYQITPSWDILIPISELRLRLTGFADFIGDRGPGTNQIITQPQFLIDVGNFWNDPGRIFTGIEYHYIHNVGGEEGVNESVVQFGLIIDLG